MYYKNTKSKFRILIDLMTVSDCLDAATDVFGRNYARGKLFDSVIAEFRKSAGVKYNPDIINFILETPQVQDSLRELTSQDGRAELYYHIYRNYR